MSCAELWYFVTLGIEPTQDRQAIKRAYAVALKRIDQQLQPEEFQRLREAYELALAWEPAEHARQENEDARRDDSLPLDEPLASSVRPIQVTPANNTAPRPVAPMSDPSSLGDGGAHPPQPAVLPGEPATRSAEVDLAALRSQMREALEHWTAQLCQPGLADADQLLDAAFADPRMHSLDASAQLQARIVEFLSRSEAANLALFEAALRRFGWRDDLFSLRNTGAGRSWVERQLLSEDAWLLRQPEEERLTQRWALDQLVSAPQLPGTVLVLQCWTALSHLEDEFPGWLALRMDAALRNHCQQVFETAKKNKWAWFCAGWNTQPLAAKALIALGCVVIPVTLPLAVMTSGPDSLARLLQRRSRRLRRVPPRSSSEQVKLALGVIFIMLVFQGTPFVIKAGYAFFSSGSSEVDRRAGESAAEEPSDPPCAKDNSCLAYEFRGPIDKENCAQRREFAHESNWLSLDDPVSRNLLEEQILACVDHGLWLGGENDALVHLLREVRQLKRTLTKDVAPSTDAPGDSPPPPVPKSS